VRGGGKCPKFVCYYWLIMHLAPLPPTLDRTIRWCEHTSTHGLGSASTSVTSPGADPGISIPIPCPTLSSPPVPFPPNFADGRCKAISL